MNTPVTRFAARIVAFLIVLRNPFSYFAARGVTLSPRSLRWASVSSLVVSIFIVLSGGVVRVTGSGLGCPTWPACEATSLTPTAALGVHGIIEFSNRMVTGLIILAVAWVIIAARFQKPRVRSITRLAWSQFWLVVANALAGGVTVLTALNPWVVAMHFVMAIALLTTATLTWHRVHETMHAGERSTPRYARALSWTLTIVTLALVLAGTLVSGSGPHSGDSADVPRMPFNWTGITMFHGILGALTLVVAAILWVVLRGNAQSRLARTRVSVFLVVVVLQGAIGVTQSLSGLPELLVALHLLGAALVWVGVLRVLLDVNPRLFRGIPTAQSLPEQAISL